MTNFDFPDMQKVRDVESINIWNIGKRLHLPRSLRWRMIKTKSRDNARTPMQWNDSPNAAFLLVRRGFRSMAIIPVSMWQSRRMRQTLF